MTMLGCILTLTAALQLSLAVEERPRAQEPASASRNYVIGAQDQLSVTVFDEPGLTGKYRVENDGFFTFPLLDRIEAAGKTVGALQAELTAKLAAGFLRNPQVRIEIDQYKSQSVTVTGEVRTPGPITISGSAMTLLTALALAGSPTVNASDEVIVVHPAATGQSEGETIRVNRRDLELGRAGMDIVLRDGDIINVPKAQSFYITGYVKSPGPYIVSPGMTFEQAIAMAGGVTERGTDRGIKVSRLVKGKTVEVDVNKTDQVQPNDLITVRQRFF